MNPLQNLSIRLQPIRGGNKLIGFIGLDLQEPGGATILHIVVAPGHRGCGIGTAMIAHALKALSLSRLEAQTDRDAVDFYQKAGFTVKSLGELYPSTERFLCTMNSKAQQGAQPDAFGAG